MFLAFETSPSGKKVLVNIDNVKWIEANDAESSDLVFTVNENGPVSLAVKGTIDDLARSIDRAQGGGLLPPKAAVGGFSIG